MFCSGYTAQSTQRAIERGQKGGLGSFFPQNLSLFAQNCTRLKPNCRNSGEVVENIFPLVQKTSLAKNPRFVCIFVANLRLCNKLPG